MSCCCSATDRHFGHERAESDLAAYRRRGPRGTARRLLRIFERAGVAADTLLDIGAGVGVLHHELLRGRLGSAVHVEASGAYVEAARSEATRRGHLGRVRFLHGDFLTHAPALDPADLVTLDRVLCCYPELDSMVLVSAAKARRFWAASYPRDRWFVRAHTDWENRRRRRAGNAFRTFIHPVSAIHALLRRAGLQQVLVHRGLVWELALYARTRGSPEPRRAPLPQA